LRVHTYTFTAGSRFEGSGVVAAADRAGNASTGTLAIVRDDTPPEVTLSVPRRVYTTTFFISWDAVDAQAGVAGYDLAVKIDDGEWQQVLTNTQSTNYQFTNYPFTSPTGFHFAFRVTAADRVGNAGSVEAASRLVEVTKYYTHGGRRVAMRRNGVLTYLHGDHLGSTSLTTDANGNFVARVLYYPYGETRWMTGTLTTDYGFTGQRKTETIKLLAYGARWYDPSLGRFVSADTIVPDPANPQSLNRFAYVRNNPLRYTDPSGFFEEDQLKEWFPDHWAYWKERRPDFWNMLLLAEFDDTVWAHWEYRGVFMEGDGGVPMLLVVNGNRNSAGQFVSLLEWEGTPNMYRSYAYALDHFDKKENEGGYHYFGTVSSWWTQTDRDGFYTVHTRYETRTWSDDPFLEEFVDPGRGMKVPYLVKQIPGPQKKVVKVVDAALRAENLLCDNLVVEESQVLRHWPSSQYRPIWSHQDQLEDYSYSTVGR
jgi:RHS repeat-associated protein